MIATKDGKSHYIADAEDFVFLVSEYMGDEAAGKLRSLFEATFEEAIELSQEG